VFQTIALYWTNGEFAFGGRPTSCCYEAGRAMAERLWEIGDIVDVLEAWETAN